MKKGAVMLEDVRKEVKQLKKENRDLSKQKKSWKSVSLNNKPNAKGLAGIHLAIANTREGHHRSSFAAKKKTVASLKYKLKKARQKKKLTQEKAAKELSMMMTYAMVIRQHATLSCRLV